MDLEDYLIEEKKYILAINRISQIIDKTVKANYYKILKGKISQDYLDEIIALNTAIRMVAYCMRLQRKEYYQKLDTNYKDEFYYDSILFDCL